MGFFTTLNRTSTIRVLPAGTQQNGGEQYASVIAAPVPVMSASQTGCVAFLIRSQYFEELTEKYFPQTDLEFYVFDTMNEVLYRGRTELTEEQLSDVVRNSAVGISERTVGGTDYLVMRNISSQQNMTYVALIPTAEFFEYGKADLLSFSTLVLALLILGIVAVLLITKRATRSIERMQEEHRHVEERLDNQNRIIRQMVLNRMIKGTIRDGDERSLSYYLMCTQLEFEHPYFGVLVCMLDKIELLPEQSHRIVCDIAALASEEMHLYVLHRLEDNQIVVIVNMQRQDADRIQLAELVARAIGADIDGPFLTGCGQVYDNPFKIDNAYVEAIVAVNEKMETSHARLFLFRNDLQQEEGFVYPYVERALIEQSIRNGSSETAIGVMREVFRKIESAAPSLIIQKCLHYDIINMMVKIAVSLKMPMKAHEISKMSMLEDPQEICKVIEQEIVHLTQKVENEKNQNRFATKMSLLEYVQEHFRSNTISLNTLAEEFGLSYTYASKSFKDETGESFSSYITKLRIAYVKQKLETTDEQIKTIVLDSGYVDVANFMRKFKQVEGMTPGQYRQMRQTVRQAGQPAAD